MRTHKKTFLQRRGARVVMEQIANLSTRKCCQGSNPCLSAPALVSHLIYKGFLLARVPACQQTGQTGLSWIEHSDSIGTVKEASLKKYRSRTCLSPACRQTGQTGLSWIEHSDSIGTVKEASLKKYRSRSSAG